MQIQWPTYSVSSPEQAARQRAVADALIGQSASPAQNIGQGWSDVAAALSGSLINQKTGEAEALGRQSAAEALAGLGPNSDFSTVSQALSNPWLSGPQSQVASALLSQNLQRGDPMYQLQLQQAQLELDRALNPPSMPFNPDAPTDYQNYQLGQSDPAYAEFLASQPSGQTINVGGESANIGTIPPGYAAVVDPTSPAGYRFERIPGSQAEADAEAAAAANAKKTGQTERYGNVVTEDIGRALEKIEADPTFTTGVVGQILSQVGGTPANRVANLIETVESNVGFDRLQAMRDSSPTGGALGSVTERELSLLTSAIGSLKQSNNSDDLAYNLRRVNKIYMDIIHGPGKWEEQAKPAGGPQKTSTGVEWSF